MTAEVLSAFCDTGLRSVVLKGPALGRHLYRDGSPRSYLDADLLVAPADLPRAGNALRDLGFDLEMDQAAHPSRIPEPYAQVWRRPPGDEAVDLHWRLPGMQASGKRTSEVLGAHTEPITIGGVMAESLDRPAIALLVALHAAYHGTSVAKPLADLERALDQIDLANWSDASGLAADLDAVEAFAAGLRLLPAGEDLAAHLELPPVTSPRRRLYAAGRPPAALGILGILEKHSGRGRARAVRDAVVPTPEFMRASRPLARRGRTGLILAYLVRAVVRAGQLPGALRAVRSSRRPPAQR
jgi:hypothetical protein